MTDSLMNPIQAEESDVRDDLRPARDIIPILMRRVLPSHVALLSRCNMMEPYPSSQFEDLLHMKFIMLQGWCCLQRCLGILLYLEETFVIHEQFNLHKGEF